MHSLSLFIRVAGTAILLSVTACSSTPEPRASAVDNRQTVTINTPGVEGVMCIVQSGEGNSWNVPAPGPVTVPKTTAPLIVNCFKGDHLRGSAKAEASFAPAEAMAGGACVTCRYPGIIEVAMRLNDSLMDIPTLRQQP